MRDTIQVEHGFTLFEEYLHDLFMECRELIEEAQDSIARSKKARKISKELLISSREIADDTKLL